MADNYNDVDFCEMMDKELKGLLSMTDEDKINEAAQYILDHTDKTPEIAVILGSGLGDYAERIKGADYINYRSIPFFPVSSVAGHKGRFVVGSDVLCMQGRIHYYEGNFADELAFPVRVLKRLGIETLIVTNAAGGVNRDFKSGDLMLITDHINLMGANPLIGRNLDTFGPRFPDMTEAYNKRLIEMAKLEAANLGIAMQQGVYAAFSGPNYETPAEIRMAAILGADAVGMSSVPEVIAARHCGIDVLGISLISNMAAGISENPLNHKEVMEAGIASCEKFCSLIDAIIKELLAEGY